jgi:hypothetical protein
MNKRGNPETLQARQPGNRNRLTHGAYSKLARAELEPAAKEIADALMQAPHVDPLDRLAAEEIGALVVQLDRIDAALADGRVERGGTARALIVVRDKLSGRLESWLRQFGLTPASRAEWARQLAEGESLAETIRRRRAAISDGGEVSEAQGESA